MRGKVFRLIIENNSRRDHPRLCGEKFYEMYCLDICTGSPPPMRGKGSAYTDISRHFGDHPRLCGEKASANVPVTCPTGSPPPMRGKVRLKKFCLLLRRITPAYAGKSSVATLQACHSWDHPRLCGEKCILCKYTKVFLGSPPPMRGKAINASKKKTIVRITPAYAGKRNTSLLAKAILQDHPRLCGEKTVSTCPRLADTGSPPPMRGKGPHRAAFQRSSRITPAYAGKRSAV